MIGHPGRSSKCRRVLRWLGLVAAAPALWACSSRTLETPTIHPTATVSTTFTQKLNNTIDLLFMIDDSSSMSEMQGKLYDQLPSFIQVLQNLPNPPSLHVAVVSSDMGAPGDSATSIPGCSTHGDDGAFQYKPKSSSALNVTCTDTTLRDGAAYISDADGMPNYSSGDIASVFKCIALLGDTGCGFEHQLASIDHALGSDNFQPDPNNPGKMVPTPPSTNVGFLRDDAYLGIVLLTNEDDCSAPQNTKLFSLASGGSNQQNIANALGPVANYRCNQFGHLCTFPDGSVKPPPLTPPDGQTTLDLTNCISNDTGGLLTPVSQFVTDIKKLKPDPDNQILVAAITAPPTPYAVEWLPPSDDGQNTQPGEVWPSVMHSCGAVDGEDGIEVNPKSTMHTTDGSFGDPGVRITQFVQAFQDSLIGSICAPDYSQSMMGIASKLGVFITPPCIKQKIQNDADGNPMCSVVENVTNGGATQKTAIPYCGTNNNTPPCWTLAQGDPNSCAGGETLSVNDPNNQSAQSLDSVVQCSFCIPGATQTGC